MRRRARLAEGDAGGCLTRRKCHGTSWYVMECHVCHARGSYPVAGSGMKTAAGFSSPGLFPRAGRGDFRRPVRPAEAVSVRLVHDRSSISFRSTPSRSLRRRPGRAADPDSRVSRARLRRRGRAYRGGAARAPDCARETQGAPLPCVSQGFFRAGANAKQETKRPRECRFLPSAPYWSIFSCCQYFSGNNSRIIRTSRFSASNLPSGRRSGRR